jgi:ABC-type transporter Mla subunit MlaD
MQIDPAKQAEELAQIFFTLSNAVNDFRLRPDNFNALPPDKQQQLKDQAQALAMRGQQYTADALAAILQAIQPHLQDIKQATQGAKEALAHLNDVEKGIAIVDAAVALARSIADGDIGSIGDNVQNLIQTISPTNKS